MFRLGTPGTKSTYISICLLAAQLVAWEEVANAEQAPALTYASQGWSDADRGTFYTTSQGSRMIPLAWFKALRRLDADEPFAADQLRRYGYLPNNSQTNTNELPIGFVVDKRAPSQLGMTCAACHTNQLEYEKDGVTRALRLDGAPALADFQQFLTDLTAAARATSWDSERFINFAKAVLGVGITSAKSAQLKKDFDAWVRQFAEFMDKSLPPSAWGPGRLDAFGMIFNRVTGRDLGLIDNFKVADAPVSYPFLWNASLQDHTQWNGGVPNGLYVQALARNTGEVFGVFADFTPTKVGVGPLAKIDYRNSSADFAGLQTLEEKIATLNPPRWPREIFELNDEQAKVGEQLFATHCANCHAERSSPVLIRAWATPVRAVGTDPKMVRNSERKIDPGVFIKTPLPPPAIAARFANPANATDVLASSVIGALVDEAFLPIPITPAKIEQSGVWRAFRKDLVDLLPGENLQDLLGPTAISDIKALFRAKLADMFKKPASADPGPAYESRVLRGIWATAPYLHNGSVPNLWELLKPAKERAMSFKVGERSPKSTTLDKYSSFTDRTQRSA
jgi:hypothetical protein